MPIKKTVKKLVLSKKTIANLGNEELSRVRGGAATHSQLVYCCSFYGTCDSCDITCTIAQVQNPTEIVE